MVLIPMNARGQTHVMIALGIGNRRSRPIRNKNYWTFSDKAFETGTIDQNTTSQQLKILKMGKRDRSSVGGAGEIKKAKSVKSLVADEAVVDPGLAALFASSVSTALRFHLKFSRFTY